jgi:hypothetical protein
MTAMGFESVNRVEIFCWMGEIMPASRDFLERMLAREVRSCDRHSATKSAKKVPIYSTVGVPTAGDSVQYYELRPRFPDEVTE